MVSKMTGREDTCFLSVQQLDEYLSPNVVCIYIWLYMYDNLSDHNNRAMWKEFKAYENSFSQYNQVILLFIIHAQEKSFNVLIFLLTILMYVMWSKVWIHSPLKMNFNGEFTHKIVYSKVRWVFQALWWFRIFVFFLLWREKNSQRNIHFSKSETLFYRTGHNKNFLYICFNDTFS